MKTFCSLSPLVAIAALIGISTSSAFAATSPGSATVTAVRGTGYVGDQPAKVNAVVQPGSTLVTSAESTIDLNLKDNGPFVRVQPDSRLALEDLTVNKDGAETVITTRLGLKTGKVTGYVKKTSDQSRYTVETPTTTAAIRGTKYLVSADGEVWVTQGCVNVLFRNINYSVCAGQGFDPRIPGVVDLTPSQIDFVNSNVPTGPTGERPPTPIGPVINVSPVGPSSSSSRAE